MSPIGLLELEIKDETLVALRIVSGTSASTHSHDDTRIRHWLDTYFAGREPDFVPSIAPHGTAFQRRVWQELLTVPYGQTVTYGELAKRLGCRSPQAVGQAVARNPIAIVIPCHRVVASDGIGGYAYGSDIKRRLLSIEKGGEGLRVIKF